MEVRMRNFWIAGVAALAIAGSTAVYAQHHRHWGQMRMAPEDRAAFVDARIAAVHAGLKLNAEQEKLWPPVETAVREFAKLRIDRANARMNAPADATPPDPVTRLRERADTMATSAASLTTSAPDPDKYAKPLESSGFSPFRAPVKGRENLAPFAGQWGVALLNDPLSRRLFRTGSGRIAQLVEQLTLNQRVPGSSPGAPTKLFKYLSERRVRELSACTPPFTVLFSLRASATA